MNYKNIGILASKTEPAQKILSLINKHYKFISIDHKTDLLQLDLIIVLGGDGFMLHSLHNYMHLNIPLYGVNCGTVGFLLNHFEIENLIERINKSTISITYPLEMIAKLKNNSIKTHFAINEVSLFRKTSQAAKIQIIIDNDIRLEELVSDGVLIATPAGSSAYNSSVNGPILPIGSNILALTPISPFKPKRWHGALLPHTAKVELKILDSENRPVNAVADFLEVDNIISVSIRERRDMPIKLLFDPNHSLEERILKAQFHY